MIDLERPHASKNPVPAETRFLRRAAAPLGSAVLLAAFLLLAFGALVGCGSAQHPESTLSDLGDVVGVQRQDEIDFETLMDDYTTEDYAQNTEAELVNYQLFLAAKASDISLNQADPPDLVETTVEESGDEATVTFDFQRREGLFAVADISTIVIQLVDTGAEEHPWRIRSIDLERQL